MQYFGIVAVYKIKCPTKHNYGNLYGKKRTGLETFDIQIFMQAHCTFIVHLLRSANYNCLKKLTGQSLSMRNKKTSFTCKKNNKRFKYLVHLFFCHHYSCAHVCGYTELSFPLQAAYSHFSISSDVIIST